MWKILAVAFVMLFCGIGVSFAIITILQGGKWKDTSVIFHIWKNQHKSHFIDKILKDMKKTF